MPKSSAFFSHLLKQLEFSGSQLKRMTKQWVREKSLRKHKGVGSWSWVTIQLKIRIMNCLFYIDEIFLMFQMSALEYPFGGLPSLQLVASETQKMCFSQAVWFGRYWLTIISQEIRTISFDLTTLLPLT